MHPFTDAVACERCGRAFEKRPPTKRFCSDRCRRIVANRRYRRRHTEIARCIGCGELFSRSSTTKRKKRYCGPSCLAKSRSDEYKARPDIQHSIVKARTLRGARAQPEPEPALDRATQRFLNDDAAIDLIADPWGGWRP
jgi:predicted nucleic acid-binding Zn ribbon protein